MEELNFYQLAKKKQELEKQEETYPIREDIPAEFWGKPIVEKHDPQHCLLYTSPSPRDYPGSRMPSSA